MNEQIEKLPEELKKPVIEQVKELGVFHRYCSEVRDGFEMLEGRYSKYTDRFGYCKDSMQKIIVNLRQLHDDLSSIKSNLED